MADVLIDYLKKRFFHIEHPFLIMFCLFYHKKQVLNSISRYRRDSENQPQADEREITMCYSLLREQTNQMNVLGKNSAKELVEW